MSRYAFNNSTNTCNLNKDVLQRRTTAESNYSVTLRNCAMRLKRNAVVIAPKHRLKKSMVKMSTNNQQYCKYYCRFGRCTRQKICPYVHDPQQIIVCTRFLKGTCKMTNCSFSHHMAPDKMPVCSFFLQGRCTNDPCPYRHVKVNEKARLCKDFDKGFCPAGEQCKYLHKYTCTTCSTSKKRVKNCKKCMLLNTNLLTNIHNSSVNNQKQQVVCEENMEVKENIQDNSTDPNNNDDSHSPRDDMNTSYLPEFIPIATESDSNFVDKDTDDKKTEVEPPAITTTDRNRTYDYDSDDTWYTDDDESAGAENIKIMMDFLYDME